MLAGSFADHGMLKWLLSLSLGGGIFYALIHGATHFVFFLKLTGIILGLHLFFRPAHMEKIRSFPWDSLEDQMQYSVPNLNEAAMA